MSTTILRRLMARSGLTVREVVERTGLHHRTVNSLLAGSQKPHAKTLHKLAVGLGVEPDAIVENSRSAASTFDYCTNPNVREFVDSHRESLCDWTLMEIEELFSRFGTGGEMTESAVLTQVERVVLRRDILDKVAIVMETDRAEFLAELVEMLFQSVSDVNGHGDRPN